MVHKMNKPTGLGRGLDAFFHDDIENDSNLKTIKISMIEPKKDQPRKYFDEEALSQLSSSIAAHGLLQPILVRELPNDRYQIIAGERRWRASKMAGLTEIPVIVTKESDEETAKMALIENIQRENLNPLEEALAYKSLMDGFGLTQEKVSETVGKSRPAIANTLRLLELPEQLLPLVKEGTLTSGHARTLLGCKNEKDMIKLGQLVADAGMSVRELEKAVKKANKVEEIEESEDKIEIEVDYAKELSSKIQSILGRRVHISDKSPVKFIQLYYEDNQDLESILVSLIGKEQLDNL